MAKKVAKPVQQELAGRHKATAMAKLERLYNELPEVSELSFEEAVNEQPVVTSILRAAAGGIPSVIDALRASEDDDACAFIGGWDSLTETDRRYCSLEAIGVACGLDSRTLRDVAISAILDFESEANKVLVATNISKIIRKSVKVALTTKGVTDREMMLKAGGILPIPKGATIAIQNVNNAKDDTEPSALPSWDQERQIKQIHESWGERTKALPAGELHPPISPAVDSIQRTAVETMEDV